jgi:hypothetical protein
MQTHSAGLADVPVLLRGEAAPIKSWIDQLAPARLGMAVFIIAVGTGLFGAAMGLWRAPLQALYTAIKFPLIIFLTTLGTALLNGMLAPLLGLNLRFAQSLAAVLMSFTIFALILGSFSPVMLFLIWNTPPYESGASIVPYRFVQLTQVAIIAFAGVAAHIRLLQLLAHLSGSKAIAAKILVAWLAANLFLGSQLVWILRPLIGSPGLPTQFLRPDAFKGNFYETVFYSVAALLSTNTRSEGGQNE